MHKRRQGIIYLLCNMSPLSGVAEAGAGGEVVRIGDELPRPKVAPCWARNVSWASWVKYLPPFRMGSNNILRAHARFWDEERRAPQLLGDRGRD